MFKVSLIIIIIIIFSSYYCEILLKSNQNKIINQCIEKISGKYFEEHVLIMSNIYFDTDSIFFNSNNLKKTFTTFNVNGKKFAVPQKFWKFNNFIFIINNKTSDINLFFKSLFGTQLWNSRGRYLVGYLGDEDIGNLFNISWQYYVYNINVVSLNNNKDLGVDIFTYFPYKNSCGQFSDYEILGLCENTSLGNLYPEKIPLDLKGCDLKMMAYPMLPYVININANREKASKSGLEVTIIHTLSQRMNFKEVYVPHTHAFWGYKDLAGKYQFMFGSLYNKECALTLGMQFGNASHVVDFDGSFVHLIDKSVWWVPAARPIAQWKNITTIFNGDVWLAIFIVFIVNGFAFWLTGRKKESSDEYNDIILSVMQSLYSLLQGSVQPPMTWILRMIFIIWLLSCLLLFTAHQSQLVSILTSPLYEHQLKSMAEVVNSDLKYGMFIGASLAYTDPTNWVHVKIYQNFYACNLTNSCLNRTAFQRDMATVRNLRNSRYFIPRFYTDSNGKIVIYELEGDALGIWVRFYTTKGYPLLDRINHFLMLLQSNGLIAKWDSDISFFVLKLESEPDHKPLTLDHLQGAFYILGIGVTAGLLTVFVENVKGFYNRFKLNRRNNFFKNVTYN